ncbi:unnamed protein product [Discosporangium mesarthrocarpum]
MKGKHVFVTVGTTKFDDLTRAVEEPKVLQYLYEGGFTTLVAQIGHGEHEPTFGNQTKLRCEYFRFKPTLQDDIERADLVISHAGAGSIMEALGKGKTLVAVVNDRLMHNHQEELASIMAERGYMLATTPRGLADAVAQLQEKTILPYPLARPQAFVAVVDEEMHSIGAGGGRKLKK